MPKRIQRKRTAGWRKPAATVIVSRPSRFGNPFTLAMAYELGYAAHGDSAKAHEVVVGSFAAWLAGDRYMWQNGDEARERILAELPSLRGKNLACYCPEGSFCHADRLLALANMPEREQAAWIQMVRDRVELSRAQARLKPLRPAILEVAA